MTMRPELQEFMEECERILQSKDPTKDATWTCCQMSYLYDKLMSHIESFQKVPDAKKLIHISNYSMMLWHRLGK